MNIQAQLNISLFNIYIYIYYFCSCLCGSCCKSYTKNRTEVSTDSSDILVSYFVCKCDLGKFWLSHLSTYERT